MMFTIKNVSRYKAASIHLAISATIAALVLSAMLALWYPGPLFSAMGGTLLIALIVGVDVAIGPLITLIIFDTKKKELLLDLAIIAILQLAALIYGVQTMYVARPAFVVFTGQQFTVVIAAEIDPKELAKARYEEFRRLSLVGPKLVATAPPTKPDEISDLAFARFFGVGIQHMPKYYVPYNDKRATILKASHPLAGIKLSDADTNALKKYLLGLKQGTEKLHYLPMSTKNAVLTAILDDNGDLLDTLNIAPLTPADEPSSPANTST